MLKRRGKEGHRQSTVQMLSVTPRRHQSALSYPQSVLLVSDGGLPALFGDPPYSDLLLEIIASPALQRLRDIRFLGAIDYVLPAKGSTQAKRHTRFEHSLNVAILARAFSQQRNLNLDQEKHLVVAALLHDIGHGPLSHSLEPVFKERFRISHHRATALIVQGTVPIGTTLPTIFKKHGIDRRQLIALIAGEDVGPHAEALNHPINVDTIEGILRAYSYMAPEERVPSPLDVLTALVGNDEERDLATLDNFWQLKDFVYEHLINSAHGVVADYVCQEYARKYATRFWSGNYFISETELRKQHPDLFKLLQLLRRSFSVILAGNSVRLDYERRRFYVDESVRLTDLIALRKRYRQIRVPAQMKLADVFSSRSGDHRSEERKMKQGSLTLEGGQRERADRKE